MLARFSFAPSRIQKSPQTALEHIQNKKFACGEEAG
jgi:hypothetical protein